MELPLDHFRLIGVSPSATSEEILRAFQLRLDKTPDEGFTYEVLTQRSELLRLTADLLTDPESRREYENLLLNGASGLEFSIGYLFGTSFRPFSFNRRKSLCFV